MAGDDETVMAAALRAHAEFAAAVVVYERLALEWEIDRTDQRRFAQMTAAVRAVFAPAAVVADAMGEHRAARLWRSLAEIDDASVHAVWTLLIAHMNTLLMPDEEVQP